ncbi:hypothetical protein AB0K16_44480 [Nonomuraea jabiensis]|uniref:hypothetical protein n=1 Tax=Nonomuraea jabiensis TaxID=882448 RepID=UPI003433241B
MHVELRGKLAECLWWVFVLADKLGVDMPDACKTTIGKIANGLNQTLGKASGKPTGPDLGG